MRRYLACIGIGNLLWEIAQLPLYTLWRTGTAREMAFAVLHCTGGDLLIAACALILALVLAGDARWPVAAFQRVAILTLVLGVGYTIFSEWLNILVRKSWAYSAAMPLVPWLDVGLSPLMQWIFIPLGALLLARRAR